MKTDYTEMLYKNATNLKEDGNRCAVFGKSCIYGENFGASSHYIFFDYDTKIFDIYVGINNEGKKYVDGFQNGGWRYSKSTTRHTKTALDMISLAIYGRYDIFVEPSTYFTKIDEHKAEIYTED